MSDSCSCYCSCDYASDFCCSFCFLYDRVLLDSTHRFECIPLAALVHTLGAVAVFCGGAASDTSAGHCRIEAAVEARGHDMAAAVVDARARARHMLAVCLELQGEASGRICDEEGLSTHL